MLTARRVLAVEDDENVRGAVAAFLSLLGCDVTSARDGAEAVAYLERHMPPELIVLDLLPTMDGRALRAYQLGRPELAQIPVIVLTTHGEVDKDALIFRGVRWLAKPFRANELRDAVSAALQI